MIAAAVVRNAVVLKLAVVNASNAVIHAVIHAAINVAVIMVDMVTDMDMAMDTVTDLDLVDVLGSGLFLFYSSAVADGDSAADLEDMEDMVIQVSSNI